MSRYKEQIIVVLAMSLVLLFIYKKGEKLEKEVISDFNAGKEVFCKRSKLSFYVDNKNWKLVDQNSTFVNKNTGLIVYTNSCSKRK